MNKTRLFECKLFFLVLIPMQYRSLYSSTYASRKKILRNYGKLVEMAEPPIVYVPMKRRR